MTFSTSMKSFSSLSIHSLPSITDPKERELHFWQDDHYRLYGRDYPRVLGSIGFESKEEDFLKEFTDEEIRRYGFMKEEKIYTAVKPAGILSEV